MAKRKRNDPEPRRFSDLGIQEKAKFYRGALDRIPAGDLRAALAAYLAAFDFVDCLVPEHVGQIIGTMAAAADPEAIRQVLGKVIPKRDKAQRQGETN